MTGPIGTPAAVATHAPGRGPAFDARLAASREDFEARSKAGRVASPDGKVRQYRAGCVQGEANSKIFNFAIRVQGWNRGEAGPMERRVFRDRIARPSLGAGLIPNVRSVLMGTWQVSSDLFSFATSVLSEVTGASIVRPLNALVGNSSVVVEKWNENPIAGVLQGIAYGAVQGINIVQVIINLAALLTSRLGAAGAVVTVATLGLAVAIVAAPFFGIFIGGKKALPYLKAALSAIGNFIKEKAPVVGNFLLVVLATIAYPFILAVKAMDTPRRWLVNKFSTLENTVALQGWAIASGDARRYMAEDHAIALERNFYEEDLIGARDLLCSRYEKYAQTVLGIWSKGWSDRAVKEAKAEMGKKALLNFGATAVDGEVTEGYLEVVDRTVRAYVKAHSSGLEQHQIEREVHLGSQWLRQVEGREKALRQRQERERAAAADSDRGAADAELTAALDAGEQSVHHVEVRSHVRAPAVAAAITKCKQEIARCRAARTPQGKREAATDLQIAQAELEGLLR